MKSGFVSYASPEGMVGGYLSAGRVIDLGSVERQLDGHDAERALRCQSVRGMLGLGRELRQRIATLATQMLTDGQGADVGTVRLGPPVVLPEKVICVGLNYRDHAEELGLEIPSVPVLFPKVPRSLIGTAAPIEIPRVAREIDYEVELAVIIGDTCRDVTEADAMEYVAGFSVINDVSARDLQFQADQWLPGKAIDTFGPCGPTLVPKEDVADVYDLAIRTRVNGTLLQDGNTRNMIFSVEKIMAFMSSFMTLVPGDVIATGTPAGVGMGRTPNLWLADGDRVEVEIDGIGRLENPVRAL